MSQSLFDHGRIKSYMLPKVEQMACVIHQGSYDTLVQTSNALLQWIEANNYQVAGLNREIYLQAEITDADFMGDSDRLTIEIQFPVSVVKMRNC